LRHLMHISITIAMTMPIATAWESNRAKPPDEGRFVPESEPRRTKIAPHGETMLARAAHLFPESGYFSSVPFSRSA
jgi:hypothetical protein